MIYLVKEKDYKGIYHKDFSKEIIDMLLSKGGQKVVPYNSPCKTVKNWDELSEEVKMEQYYCVQFSNGVLLDELEYSKIYKEVEVLSLISQDIIKHEVDIDLDKLSTVIANKVMTNSSHLFNKKLEVHQPNMPLFQYNNYRVLEDCCTESLQDYIDRGWRVVCVCPQPDQRRPDYILGKYVE